MELSNMPTGKGLDAMAAMLPHMETILNSASFVRLKDRVRANAQLTLSDILSDAFAVVAVDNRLSLYGIVAAASGKTPEEVAEQPLEETLAVFRDAMGAQVLDFFTFCARLAVRL